MLQPYLFEEQYPMLNIHPKEIRLSLIDNHDKWIKTSTPGLEAKVEFV